MSKPPACMKCNNRHPVPHFEREEYLFRRVPLDYWDEPCDVRGLDVDAVLMPDVSVGRSKFGHPEWVRFDVINGHFFEGWGILGFQVQNVPGVQYKDGIHFTFTPMHKPLEMDYPHSEIQAFENGNHIDEEHADELPEDVHLAWREKLLRKAAAIIKPRQKVVIRDTPPRLLTSWNHLRRLIETKLSPASVPYRSTSRPHYTRGRGA